MSALLIHISAFFRKEVFEILRQPKLLLTLVAGPFLILLIFGVGNRVGAPNFRITFVAAKDSQVEGYIKQFASRVTGSLIVTGVVSDKDAALADLRNGKVDLVAVAPDDPYALVRASKQAQFGLFHNEIDPVQAGYVNFLWDYFINEINRQLMEEVVKASQSQAVEAQTLIADAKQSAAAMRVALESGDAQAARKAYNSLAGPVNGADGQVRPTLDLIDSMTSSLANGGQGAPKSIAARTMLSDLRKDMLELSSIQDGKPDYALEVRSVRRVEDRLTQMSTSIDEFKAIAPNIIVRPLTAQTSAISPVNLDVMAYFAPAVIVLLLQHLLITMSALSLVRERMSGAIELFRASPLTALEILVGKYLSYIVLGAALAAVLTAALIFLLRVPMLGSWLSFAGVVLMLLFASLGWGTLISIISENDTQAVQYSMLLLLGSVFFSGAFLALYNIQMPSQIVSWLLPATYAIQLLQGVMLRGQINAQWILWGLLAMGVLFFIVNLALLRHKMARE
jgi:ABC-2 type transport system permease protein